MSLSELKIPANIQVNVTEKQYFNKYPFKIELEATVEKSAGTAAISSGNHHSWNFRMRTASKVKFEITDKINRLFKSEELDTGKTYDYRLRQEGYTVSIYFSDPAIMNLLFNNSLKRKIKALYKPYNDNHLAKMDIETRVRVRKSLFLGKYKFKAYLSTMLSRKLNLVELVSWLEDAYPEEGRYELNPGLRHAVVRSKFTAAQQKYRSWQYNTVLAIYVNDETDLMMLHLRLNDCISYAEEAVLISEL